MDVEAKKAGLEKTFRHRAIPEAAALLPVLDELAARLGLIWRYDPELGMRASCTAASPTITTGGAGTAGDAWTDDGEPDHLCPVALLAITGEAATAGHLERVRTVHDEATERVHDALRRSGHYPPPAELDPERLAGAEKLLVMASDGEAGAGCYAWPPATQRPGDRDCSSCDRGVADRGDGSGTRRAVVTATGRSREGG